MIWRSIFTRRRVFAVLVLVVLYGVLWLLTAAVGAPKTRMVALRAMREIPASWTDTSYGDAPKTKGPTYFCRASAYAPFLVRIDYGWVSGPLTGDGGSVWYFWTIGSALRVYEFEHWMA